MRILVTGGAGYVGSHCCKALARAGWEVVVYDNLSRGWRDFVRWGPLIEADILDLEALRAAMREVRPDAVAHFAALSEAGESVEAPARYYRTNVQGALNLLDGMREFKVDKLVFSSTCASYGLPQFLPITEAHPQWPINPYGWSKLMVERLLADYGRAHGLRYVALRYFNAAGAGGDIGERHEPETHLIPLIVRAALDPSFPFTVLGNDFDTPDGTAIRDYVHVSDLAEAHCLALSYLGAGGDSDAFNLGAGIGSSVLEVAAAAERVIGKPIARQIGPRRPGDPARLIADPAKAKAALGWRAKYPGLDHIIASALAWHARDNPASRTA